MNEDRAFHNLHNTIYLLKKILKEQEISMNIFKTNEGYFLENLGSSYDLLKYHKIDYTLMESVQDAAESERMFALYRGPLLDRKDYIWKAQLEVSYCKQYKLLVSGMIKADMAGQEWSKAEQKLDVYLSMYPLDEEMHQLLIDIFAVSGKR